MHLGLKHSVLAQIEKAYPHDQARQKQEMVSTWIQSSPVSPWASLVKALDNMGYKQLAKKILDTSYSCVSQPSTSGIYQSIYPTQPCILGKSHGLKVIIHSLQFDNALLCVAASQTNQVGYIIQHSSDGVRCR